MLQAFLSIPVASGVHALDAGAPWPLAFFITATVAAVQLVGPLAIVGAVVEGARMMRRPRQ